MNLKAILRKQMTIQVNRALSRKFARFFTSLFTASKQQNEALKSFADFKPRILNSLKLAPLVVENGSKKITREWKELRPKKNKKNSSVRFAESFEIVNSKDCYKCQVLPIKHSAMSDQF